MTTSPEPFDEEDVDHNTFHFFFRSLTILSYEAERQCEEMGDFNTAWELKNDVMNGESLLGSNFLTDLEKRCISVLLAALEPIPVNEMPAGVGRAPNLEAMNHPAWLDVREFAKYACIELAEKAMINDAYFQLGPSKR